jgi:CTP:molybdopterin cytidylyltransferase MocA
MPQVTAILLAAGSSRRMGRTKQLLLLNGKPLIRHCLDSIFGAGIERPIVVLGPGAEPIQQVIEDLSITMVCNDHKDSEMADSVRVGLDAVDDKCSGILICLTDHPMVSTKTYRTLIEAYMKNPDQILIPTWMEKRGHPTLFPLNLLKDFFNPGAARRERSNGLRDIILRNSLKVKLVPVADEGVVLDLDTEQEYRTLRARVENLQIPEEASS